MNRFRSIVVPVLAVLAFTALPAAASHVFIAPTDLATVDKGALFRGPDSDAFVSVDDENVGLLVNRVYFNSASGVYTYTHDVLPRMDNISEFNTGFDVRGFNGVAGYDFADAAAAGESFAVEHESDGTIDWDSAGEGFDAGEDITFFFQSILPPTHGIYNLINTRTGQAESYAPIPAPAALPAGLALLSIFALRRRRIIG